MRPARTLSIAVVVLALVLSLSAAPIAAMPDDGLLGGDVSGEDGLLGGDSGVPVADGADGNLSTDEVVDGTEEVTDSLGDVGDTDVPIVPDAGDGLPDAGDGLPDAGDGLPNGSAPAIPNASEVVGPEGIVDTDDSDVDASRIDILGPLPNTGENAGTIEDTLSASDDDLPVSGDQVPDDALPTDQAPGPEALPVGSNSQIGCSKPVTADDLPAEAVPYIDDLPAQPPTVPLLPTRVASPGNLAGLGFSFAPDTCDIYDPDDPSIDPTDPPTNPTSEYETTSFSATDERASYYGLGEGELSEGGPGWDGLFIFLLTEERAASVNEVTVTDGQTDNYAGAETDMRARRDLEQSQAEFTVYIPGAGGLNTGFECGNVPEHEVDPLEEPTATCEIDQPIPEVVTPEKVVNVIKNPPEYDLPNIEGDQLPIDV
jgi:hypothetical protein